MQFDSQAAQPAKVEYYRQIARAYVDRCNAKDAEGILALFADDAEIHDPVGQRDISGKDALRNFYSSVCAGPARMLISGSIRGSFGNAVATPLRVTLPDREIDVITVTRFDEAGLIADYSAFWGPSDVRNLD